MYISKREKSLIWSNVDLEMFCHLILPCESFIALSAHERSLPCVLHHVALQVASVRAGVVAMVTLKWLFSGVNLHVLLQVKRCHTSVVALITLKRLFSGVNLHVALQMARCHTSVVALIALEWFFPCMVPHHVNFQITCCNTGNFARCTSVRLFPRVGPFVLPKAG